MTVCCSIFENKRKMYNPHKNIIRIFYSIRLNRCPYLFHCTFIKKIVTLHVYSYASTSCTEDTIDVWSKYFYYNISLPNELPSFVSFNQAPQTKISFQKCGIHPYRMEGYALCVVDFNFTKLAWVGEWEGGEFTKLIRQISRGTREQEKRGGEGEGKKRNATKS